MNPTKDIRPYLPFYLGCEVKVRKKMDAKFLERYFIGRICEVTRESNHGDWIKVWFDDCHTVMYNNFHESTSNAHTFFIQEDEIKPILRRLSSMSEDEAREFCIKEGWGENLSNIVVTDNAIEFNQNAHTQAVSIFTRCRPEMFVWFLSKGFWLFGDDWFDEGIIIDADTLK